MNLDLPARGETARWNGGTWRIDGLGETGVALENVLTGEREQLRLAEWFAGVEAKVIERRVRPLVLHGDRPRKGAYMRWNDATWRVCVVRSGIISLQDAATDETGSISLKDFQAACYEGDIEMVSAPGAELDERTRQILSIPITSLPQSVRKPVEKFALFFDAWRNPGSFFARHKPEVPEEDRVRPRFLSQKYVEPFLATVAEAHKVSPPAFSTWCKWLTKVERAGGDIRAVAPRHDLQGPHKRYMNPRVEQWLSEAVDKLWLQRRKNKKNKVYAALLELVSKWNKDFPGRALTCPSEAHVARWMREEVDQYTVARRRGTKEDADRLFRQVGKAPEIKCILERVEVDHSFINLRVKDDKTGVVLGCPWLTAALDKASRMPLAAHLNFENQSIGANLQCLRQAMSPKGFLHKLIPDLNYEYPTGAPETFYFDMGPDYVNETVKRIGLSLQVMIDYEPVAMPEYKGGIERFWRTLKEDVIYGLLGAKLPGEKQVAGVDEDGEAWITYSELYRRIWEWISLVYARSYHRGIHDIPLRVWQEQASRTLPRAVPKKADLNVLLTRVEKCKLDVRGVTFGGLTWTEGPGAPLNHIMRHPSFREGMEVEVRINEYDVSQAWVINPFSRKDEELKPLLADYMRGLSVFAHDRILKNTKKPELGALDQRALMAAKQRMRDQEVALFEAAAKAVRAGTGNGKVGSQVAKFAGIGQQAPAGDSLGDVLPATQDDTPEVLAAPLADVPPVASRVKTQAARPRIQARSLRNDN
ncbi:DDE-type integrase/transposase/recombinase [Acidisphaera sp. L21]|uniref:DDE-type integrase/transposase/recombinase n=1 Tax=Acidisphaera sp. L21 TaxID=1641851 RepID=UPI00131E0640|nr:DDE-type integrase/transposase/recombinase [Acidisphaera sp. L21]